MLKPYDKIRTHRETPAVTPEGRIGSTASSTLEP